jgi:hypothetical protein
MHPAAAVSRRLLDFRSFGYFWAMCRRYAAAVRARARRANAQK